MSHQLHALVYLGEELQTVAVLQTLDDDLDDRKGHLGQRPERLVAVNSLLQVHLAQAAQTILLEQVDEQPGLHPVAREEGHARQRRATTRVLAGQRLQEARQLREEQVQQRSGGQLRHAATAAALDRAAEPQRPAV